MRYSIRFLLFFVLVLTLFSAQGQETKGKVVVEQIYSASLKNNGGENPTRSVNIYLPPNYEISTKRYPVIYYLHGFTNSDSISMTSDHFDRVLDKAIKSGKISPVIVVIPNQYTEYRGSFYSNSSLTGNWSDFTAKDLVSYIDNHYRTIADRNSRGLSGHSMGGFGTLKIALMFPDVFGCIYALSPAVSAMCKDFSISNKWTFKYAEEAKNKTNFSGTSLQTPL